MQFKSLVKKFTFASSGLVLIFALQASPALAAGPTVQSAIIDSMSGTRITLTFDDLSGNSNSTNKTDYAVTGSVQGSIGVSYVVKVGNSLLLTVSPLIAGGQTISLTYTPSTSIPANSANEPLAGFTTAVSHPGAANAPAFATDELAVNMASPNIITTYLGASGGSRLTCALTASNFQIKVNGTQRSISSVSLPSCPGTLSINLSSPLVANDQVTFSYIPSSGSVVSIFGTPAAAITDAKVYGVPDTIAPSVTIPSSSSYLVGLGGSITLQASESVSWGVTTDRTLSFQTVGNQLLVSSILPVGAYTVGITATDEAGNTTTRNITINITAVTPSPTPTPIVTSKPTSSSPVPTKAATFKSCSDLYKKYPGGVASSYNSRNKGAGMTLIPRVDAAVYKANIKLDKDKDGIVCEH